MGFYGPGVGHYGGGCGCRRPVGYGVNSFALIVVLFILLIIVGATWMY